MSQTISNVTFGMAFKAAVQSANDQGLFDMDSIQSRTVEFLQILQNLAPEYGVDLAASGRGDFPESKPTKGNSFVVDGVKWFDYRAAKDAGDVSAGFPDFKSYDGDGASLWLKDKEGNEVAEALTLAKIADTAAALA